MHVPFVTFLTQLLTFSYHLAVCAGMRRQIDQLLTALFRCKQVPSVLLSTTEPLTASNMRGEGCLLQAHICKLKRRGKGEDNASNISSMLPFVEYDLHRRLLAKIKLKGFNSLFGLKVSMSIGDTMITGTGVYLEPMPSPTSFLLLPQDPVQGLTADVISSLAKLQEENIKRYNLDKTTESIEPPNLLSAVSSPLPSTPELAEEFDLHISTTMLVEVDEAPLKEEDLMEIISDHALPQGFHVSTLSYVPGCHQQTEETRILTLTSRQFIDGRQHSQDQQCSSIFSRLLHTLLFRVRSMHPCAVTNISFNVDLPEDDEIQVTLTACATKLKLEDDLLQARQQQCDDMNSRGQKEASKDDTAAPTEIFIVSPQSYLRGFRVTKQVGTINLFLIRETTSMKELGGMGSFLQTFISEAHNIASAQVIACGGQALTDYQIKQCVIREHTHKDQGQCLLNVSGNAVQVDLHCADIDLTSDIDLTAYSET